MDRDGDPADWVWADGAQRRAMEYPRVCGGDCAVVRRRCNVEIPRNYGGSYRCVHRDCRWLSEFVILGAQNRMARGCGKGLTIGLQTMLMQP